MSTTGIDTGGTFTDIVLTTEAGDPALIQGISFRCVSPRSPISRKG